MTTVHLVLRYAHISMGMLALVSGAAARLLALPVLAVLVT